MVGLLLLAGCGSAAAPRQIQFSIVPSLDMNDARSCYVLARVVDDKQYTSESYDDVASQAMVSDAPGTWTLVVLPGIRQELTIPVPEKGRIAWYALLKQPDNDGWRVLLPAIPPAAAEIRVGKARICWEGDGKTKGGTGTCGSAVVLKR